MKKFWVKLRESEHSMLVEAQEGDFDYEGLIRLDRINKNGEKSVVMFNTKDIEVINEHIDEKNED